MSHDKEKRSLLTVSNGCPTNTPANPAMTPDAISTIADGALAIYSVLGSPQIRRAILVLVV